ncbi:hypothetical protein CRE_09463 [Caenorhabditis remanei]|uniref:Uncharacterized protein n=1 Tax=Caenorhabditis remanei TaxID=31234 RepID=E3LJ18_CAERE|nr:hypothetical protein CRE_09463 [Caenorhabditis remanei]
MCGRASIEKLCSRCLFIFPVVASITVIWTMFIASNNITPKLTDILAEVDLNETNVNTHKGYITLNEINEFVFKPFGYEIIEATLPVPTVHMLNEPSCGFIFSEWLRVSQKPQPSIPPKEIPESFSDEFLLNGYAGLTKWYFNDHSSTGDSPRNWNRTSEFMSFSKAELGALAYNKESESMYHAMSGYPLRSKSGLVIGSMQPWVEVMALKHGVRKVLTVEYNSLTIPNEFRSRLSAIKPVEFAENWQTYAGTFDFAASFSSIEHSGLGRYGDIIDPIGDLREMLKIRCLLKKGGLLFLGIPFGTDAIQYNAHRIYGSIRLAMMFYGFDWLATYSGESELPIDLTTTLLHSKGPSQYAQYTVVLKKI